MKKANQYLELLEKWDALATEQKWKPEWVEQQGEAIGVYLRGCIKNNTRPTFLGLMLRLCANCPEDKPAQAGEGTNE